MKAEQAKMKAEQALVRAWSVIYHHLNYNNNEDEDLRGEIWKYINDNNIELYKECEFETTISNAPRSTTELAHYTPNGLYYGSIEELGDEPVKVRMPFKITREMFDIDLSMFFLVEKRNFEFEWITELFEPKDDYLTPF